MKRGIIAASLLTLMCGSAFAQDDNTRGFYVGGGFGQFNVQVDDESDFDNAVTEIDDDDHAWRIFGGYRINQYFAAELNYVDFGENSGSTGSDSSGSSGNYSVDLAGFQPAIYGIVPLGPVELYAKLGYYFYDVDLDVNIDNIHQDNLSADTSEEALSYGFGVGVTFFERLNAKLEYEKIDTDVIDDLDAIWLTGAWRF